MLKFILFFFAFVLLLCLGVFVFLQTPVFGAHPSGQDLERIQKSPHYRDGQFQNEHHTPNLAEGVSYGELMLAQMRKKDPNIDPKQPCPRSNAI